MTMLFNSKWSDLERQLRSDDEKQRVFDQFADTISSSARGIAERRIRDDRLRTWQEVTWQEAYGKRGRGSSFVRASARIMI